MAEAGHETPTGADLEAAIAALPAKKKAVREAFERLAACSPYPLPFTWVGLDAHISGIQSSVSRRYRQLQVLEAARPACAAPALAKTRSSEQQQEEQEEEEEEEEEEVEVEVEEDEEEEGNENDDGEDEEGEESEEEEEEIEEEIVDVEEVEEEDVEEVKEEVFEEEVVEEAEDAIRNEQKQGADEEMQLTIKDDQNSKEEPKATGKVEEQNADEEMLPNKKEKDVEEEHKEGTEEQEEEKEPLHAEPGAKNDELSLKEDMVQKEVQRTPACGSNDLMTVCTRMDANTLVKFICCDRALGKELPIAMCHAPDAAGLVLQVVKLFLSSKKLKTTKVWNKCVSLIRCVPVTASKPSVDTIEQAKQLAKDWKEIIYKLECPGRLELLGAWGLLYFLTSYNIVSEFDTSEIIHLFSMVPRHMQKKNTMELCKGLGIAHRITDLIDYLIGKGQQLEVFHLAHAFNLSDKYPLLTLLKGYIETAKQTSMEMHSKSLNSAIPKEIENLWVAYHLAGQKITDSSQRDALRAEIKTLIDGYPTKKKRLAKTCTSKIQTQPKKCKKEEQELHKGKQSLQQDQQSKAQEQEHRQNNAQQKQQKQEKEQQHPKTRVQETQIQQHNLKRPRPCTPKLPTPVVPLVLNPAQIGHFGNPPYSTTPGVRGAPIFVLPLDAAQYVRPFDPFYPSPQFYPR